MKKPFRLFYKKAIIEIDCLPINEAIQNTKQ